MNAFDISSGHDLNQAEFDRFMEVVLGVKKSVGKAVTDPIYGTANNPLPIPEQLLREVTRDHPEIWKTADAVRESIVSRGERWPEHTFMPVAGWFDALVHLYPHIGMTPEWRGNVLKEMLVLDFIGAWRLTKKIYRFAPSLRDALMATPLSGEIPCETLKRLPEWAMFIDTQGLTDEDGMAWDGFGVCVSAHSDGTSTLHIQLMRRESNNVLSFAGTPIALVDGETLEKVVRDSYESTVANSKHFNWSLPPKDEKSMAAHVRFISGCVSMVLYLCSEEPEVAGGWKPSKPVGKRVKRGTRHFPANGITTWDVGVRIGAALDMAAEKTSCLLYTSPSPRD